jgi:acetyl-CoA synthetase
MGTMEVESALAGCPLVADAAGVGRPAEAFGEAIVAFVMPKGTRPESEEAKRDAAELRV